LDYEGFWKETLIQLRNNLGEEEFSGWFSEMKYLRHREVNAGKNNIIIGVPSAFHQERVSSRYTAAINTILQTLSGKEIALETEIIDAAEAETEPPNHSESVQSIKKDASSTEKTTKQKVKREKHSEMRDDYTFDRYVIGENNKFAANAALAISQNPGKAYNPFLIYGGVGLGKTHLMQAIGNHIHDNTNKDVIYITSENFLNEYLECLNPQERGKNTMKSFKNKYRYTDVLLIDDIQFFTDKPGVQEELFHTYTALIDAKKQIVFTCDRPISELKKFPERLTSRFVQGLMVDLQPPRYEERCAILKAEAENMNVSLSKEVIDLISNNISSNIRDLKSALTNLVAYSRLMKESITPEIAQQCLKTIFNTPRHANLSMESIIKVVAEYFGLKSYDLTGKKKSQNIVFARQLAMYVGRKMTDYSTTEIGQDFGGRDHTTVMYSIKKIEGNLLTDPAIESTIENLKRAINEYSAKY